LADRWTNANRYLDRFGWDKQAQAFLNEPNGIPDFIEASDFKSYPAQQDGADYLYKKTTYKSGIYPLNTVKGVGFLMPYMEVSGALAVDVVKLRTIVYLANYLVKICLLLTPPAAPPSIAAQLRLTPFVHECPTKKDRLGPTPYSRITLNMASVCELPPTTR
jgi:hypothetical protein